MAAAAPRSAAWWRGRCQGADGPGGHAARRGREGARRRAPDARVRAAALWQRPRHDRRHGGAAAARVLTVRAGTPLVEVEKALAAERQMLAFEPPHYGSGRATIGGMVARPLP